MTDDRAPELHVDYFGQEHNEKHEDVLTWQTEMAWRGWEIAADGTFGPESESVCRRFQASQDLDADGMVGEFTWSATWNTPVDQAEIVHMKARPSDADG